MKKIIKIVLIPLVAAESCKGKVVIQAEDIPREKRSYTRYQC